jgi:hypothetical protein
VRATVDCDTSASRATSNDVARFADFLPPFPTRGSLCIRSHQRNGEAPPRRVWR